MMATGKFALPVFQGLCESPHTVAALFTQPDRKGRGHHRHRNVLKEAALQHGIPVFQPASVNSPEALADLRRLNPDVIVVAAYGQILSPEVIAVPRLGCLNVHASLLPKYRGAAPIHHAILQGETETGITIFQIEPRLDAGPVLGTASLPILPEETTGELEERLAQLAIPLTLRVLSELEQGTARPVVQKNEEATRAPSLKKAAGRIDWTQSAEQIHRHVRAMQPWPTAYTFLQQAGERPKRILLRKVRPCEEESGDTADFPPGWIVPVSDDRLLVQTGKGLLEILRLRPEGKREMTAAEFLRGHALRPGDRLGNEEAG